MDSQLRQISQLVQEKRYSDARAPLLKYLRDNPDSAYAWYLLSFVTDAPADKQKAVRKAVQLAPDDAKYMTRLAKLGATKKRSPVLPLIILGALLIAIIAITATFLRPTAAPADSTATTVAQDGTATLESSQIAALASETGATDAIIETSILSTDETTTPGTDATESTVESEISTDSTQETDIDSTAVNATTDSNSAPSLTDPTAQSAAPLPTAASAIDGTTPPEQATQPPTRSAPEVPSNTPVVGTPFPAAPTVTPGGDAGVALSTPLDIGDGEMRIVAAVRPATTMINDLGGSAANPPAGQQWLLVEALVICSGSDNCAPALSNIRVVGSSGTVYAPAPDFSMPQLFGPGAFAVGQIWGYMGFTIPTSEATLKLALNQDGETYTFALQ